MQPVQLSLIPDPLPPTSTAPGGTASLTPTAEQLPDPAAEAAITLLADVIAKAAAARGSGRKTDE